MSRYFLIMPIATPDHRKYRVTEWKLKQKMLLSFKWTKEIFNQHTLEYYVGHLGTCTHRNICKHLYECTYMHVLPLH